MRESCSVSDSEHEIFLFNESSFANLFDSSKFNSITNSTDNTFMNLLSQSERSFRLLGTDEDFYSELENLKHLELSGFDLEEADLPESSTVSSPRFNSLMNSVTSMDLENNEAHLKEDTDSEYNNFYEDEKLINESIIASCTLTNTELNSSSSNLSDLSSAESSTQKNSTPILRFTRKNRIASLRRKLLSKSSNSSLLAKDGLNNSTLNGKSKRYLPKCERNRIAHKFYRRNRAPASNVNNIAKFNETILNRMSTNFNLVSYKQPSKVEKLLNDSRGMRKYLIDYDGLMSHQKKNQLTNLTYASLLNITSNNVTQIANFTSGASSPRMFVNSLKSISCPSRLARNLNTSLLSGSDNRYMFKSRQFKSQLKSNRTVSGNIYADSSNFAFASSRCSSNRCSSGYLTEC
jgi:hypothetical protein